jgi:hypothetical protein
VLDAFVAPLGDTKIRPHLRTEKPYSTEDRIWWFIIGVGLFAAGNLIDYLGGLIPNPLQRLDGTAHDALFLCEQILSVIVGLSALFGVMLVLGALVNPNRLDHD